MKVITSLLLALFSLSFAYAQSNLQDAVDPEKTLLRTLNPENAELVSIKIDHPIETLDWDEATVRVLLKVNLLNANEQILRQLVKVGRYSVTGKLANNEFIIDAPNLIKEITIKGMPLEEQIAVEIFVPRYTIVKTNESLLSLEKGLSQEMIDKGMAAKMDPEFKKEITAEILFSVSEELTEEQQAFSIEDILIDGKPIVIEETEEKVDHVKNNKNLKVEKLEKVEKVKKVDEVEKVEEVKKVEKVKEKE